MHSSTSAPHTRSECGRGEAEELSFLYTCRPPPAPLRGVRGTNPLRITQAAGGRLRPNCSLGRSQQGTDCRAEGRQVWVSVPHLSVSLGSLKKPSLIVVSEAVIISVVLRQGPADG